VPILPPVNVIYEIVIRCTIESIGFQLAKAVENDRHERLFRPAGRWCSRILDRLKPRKPVYRRYLELERVCDQITLARAKGRYEYLPPINKCTVTYQYWNAFNYLANVEWAAVMPQDGTNGTDEFDIGQIGNNNGVAVARFRTDIQHVSDFNTLPFVPVKHKFSLVLVIGGYYLSRASTYTDFNTITYGNVSWSAAPATVEFWTSVVPSQDNQLCDEFSYVDPATGGNYAFEIITPPITAGGDATIDFYWSQTRDNANNIITPSGGTPNVTITWGTQNEELQIWGDGNSYSQNAELQYIATNTQTGNSTNVALTSIMGDGPSDAIVSHLETWNGSSWGNSTLWGAGTGAIRDKKLLELLAAKIVSIQSSPRIKYVGTLINISDTIFFDAFHRLQILLKYYVFLGGSFEAVSDTWTNIHLFHISTELEPDTQADVPRS